MEQAKAQLEAAEISEVGKLLSSLPDRELSILKYIHSNGGVNNLATAQRRRSSQLK